MDDARERIDRAWPGVEGWTSMEGGGVGRTVWNASHSPERGVRTNLTVLEGDDEVDEARWRAASMTLSVHPDPEGEDRRWTVLGDATRKSFEALDVAAGEICREVRNQVVDHLRVSMAGLDALEAVAPSGSDRLVPSTFLGAVQHVADRLMDSFGRDPSEEAHREMAETLLGALHGRPANLHRDGRGNVAPTFDPESFDERWRERVEGE